MPITQARAVILDIDGTLIDSNDAHARSWTEALGNAGHHRPFYRVRRLIGMGGDQLLPALLGVSKDSHLGHVLDRERTRIFERKYLAELQAFPRAAELVDRLLASGLKLAVCTSAKTEHLRKELECCGLQRLLAKTIVTVTGDTVAKSKPAADGVALALERLATPASETLMLGDTPYDVEAARQLGVETVALRCGGWDDRVLADAIAIYQDPADLLERYAASPFALGMSRRRRAAA